jgi:hypothetical protein
MLMLVGFVLIRRQSVVRYSRRQYALDLGFEAVVEHCGPYCLGTVDAECKYPYLRRGSLLLVNAGRELGRDDGVEGPLKFLHFSWLREVE